MKKIRKNISGFALLTFGLFGFIFAHLGAITLQNRPNGIFVGHINLYGDLLLHLAFINKFLQTTSIIVPDPIFAGNKPNYPPFADYITAQFVKIFGLNFSLFLVTFLVGLLCIFTARTLILKIIKNEKVVFISLLLFFLNGGLGFTYFFQDYSSSNKTLIDFLFSLPREYTNIQTQGYWWINNLLAYFLPQRSFFFAFPITLTVLTLLLVGNLKNKTFYFVLAGLLAGSLPLVQAHSLFLLFIVSFFYFLISIFSSKNKKMSFLNWSIYATLTLALAFPLFKSISDSGNPLEFVKVKLGWTSNENIILFWLKNLGVFAPVLITSIIWIFNKSKKLFVLYLPFLAVFIICNIFIFQPWDFDNSKLFIYWYFASCILVSYFLYSEFFQESLIRKIIGIVLVFFMILSGSLDIFRTFTPVTNYQIFSQDDVKVAESVKTLTPPDSVFVTADNHNHPIVSLAGRTTVIGFHGWVWSHGLDFSSRAKDVEDIYQGSTLSDDLIKKYKVNFVTAGPREREEFKINDNYFSKFPQINLGYGWSLYDVGSLWK